MSHASQVVERYPKTTPQQLMFYMNAWCTAYYALYFFGFTSACQHAALGCGAWPDRLCILGAGFEAAAFCMAHAEAARQVLLYCICGAAGQARCCRGIGLVLAPTEECTFSELHILRNLELWISGEHHHHDDTQGACQSWCLRSRPLTPGRVAAQFFSVLCSVFYNKSYLRSGQWSGVALVFVGLGEDVSARPRMPWY